MGEFRPSLVSTLFPDSILGTVEQEIVAGLILIALEKHGDKFDLEIPVNALEEIVREGHVRMHVVMLAYCRNEAKAKDLVAAILVLEQHGFITLRKEDRMSYLKLAPRMYRFYQQYMQI